MKCQTVISIIFLVLISISQTKGTWDIENGDSRVQLSKYTQNNFFTLTMDEELVPKPRIILFYIINAETDPSFSVINWDNLKLETSKVNGTNSTKYAISITKQIDYEDSTLPPDKTIKVAIGGLYPPVYTGFSININNINDNSPYLMSGDCKMPENTTINIDNTNCSFLINDADGHLKTMKFKISDTAFDMDFKNKASISDDVLKANASMYLSDKTKLDYETKTIYSLKVIILDKWDDKDPGKTYTAQIVVLVQDIPDMPPFFTAVISSETFNESTVQNFQISAKDGDLEINAEINYKLTGVGDHPIQIDTKSGELTVTNIDRDVLKDDQITFTIVAYEANDKTSLIEQVVLFIIRDIDDNWPIITANETTIHLDLRGETKKYVNETIDEGAPDMPTLPVDIEVNDIDEGNNARYDLIFNDINSIGIAEAFRIIPNSGYQKSSFNVQIINSTLLDFEDPNWREIHFEVISRETINSSMTDVLIFDIKLNNLNDESPIFHNTPYVATFKETVKANTPIFTVNATDRDIGDKVRYGIVNANYLDIYGNGTIITKRDNSFDYETQPNIEIQIKATDNNDTHTVIELLTINLIDVNDETPVLTIIQQNILEIEENQQNGTIIRVSINGTDADKNCELLFSIDWENSYAMKNSIRLDTVTFLAHVNGSLGVNTIVNSIGSYTGELYIIEIVKDNTPDFEKFDSIYLNIVVTDLKQEVNKKYDSAILFIQIKNINDNPPEFTKITKNTLFQVSENNSYVKDIGIVTATDEDNLGNLTYKIIKAFDHDTKDWITVDPVKGTIQVLNGASIDSDTPLDNPRQNITYTVVVNDTKFTDSFDLTIKLIDRNDNFPVITKYTSEVHIKETVPDNFLIDQFKVYTTDIDRDEPYHTVKYSLDQESEYFKMYQNGTLIVKFQDDAYFDRDEKEKFFNLTFTVMDNPNPPTDGDQTQNTVSGNKLTIFLDDVNTKNPTIVPKNYTISENTDQGSLIAKIEAKDRDSTPPNNNVTFKILNIYSNNKVVHDLDLDIKTDKLCSTRIGNVTTNKSLKGQYGNYKLEVNVKDLGQPPRNTTSMVPLSVMKFNYFKPIITFPQEESAYYLRTTQTINSQLYLYNNDTLQNFEVDDQQPKGKWTFQFGSLGYEDGEKDDDKIFSLLQLNDHLAQLMLVKDLTPSYEKTYKLTVNASIKREDQDLKYVGEEPDYTDLRTFYIGFLDITSPPVFPNNNYSETVLIKENSDFSIAIPQASFDVQIKLNITVYYLMYDVTSQDKKFSVDNIHGNVTLADKNSTLNYEEQKNYTVKIRATTSDNDHTQNFDHRSIYSVVINVQDVNDNPPVFDQHSYVVSIQESTNKDTEILEIHASDADEVSQNNLRYYLVNYTCYGKHLDGINENSFKVDDKTGKVSLEFVVTSEMSGYVMLNVKVTDAVPCVDPCFSDEASIKIMIVTSSEIVQFNFENNKNDLENKTDKITAVFNDVLKYKSYIKSSSYNDTAKRTEALMYFISDNNTPIDSKIILQKTSDIETFTKLKEELLKFSIFLLPFDSNSSTTDMTNILKAWLIGVAVVLGTLTIILLIAFIIRTRMLTRRINNLTVQKYGSQESGLNRLGISAPTTNRHAIEGSNPVYSKEVDEPEIKDSDNISTYSGESDLIGIEDNLEFSYENNSQI